MVRDIFDRYGRGDYAWCGALAATLNAEGMCRRGRTWTDASVRDILRRAEFYVGSAVHHRGADVRPARTSRSSAPSNASRCGHGPP
jgi:hypothetical protein